jgi:hypothetical protein
MQQEVKSMYSKFLLTIISLIIFTTSNASAAFSSVAINSTNDKDTFKPVFISKSSDIKKAESVEFKIAGYSEDFTDCSNIAEKQAEGSSDTVYLGYFYGCMSQRGYKAN